ncbi:carboxypeptidase-like regulatory domain-containing protein [Algoriphagus sp. AK58]|uniref:carboxypeptidase-like regulatory domain-containing protein n=1 Tax=Algoriphagus sp. AK58 TaxID=1406877 RepID=UPI0016502330|nr:carboxypeptidase-like regulatory domain-containing protein [Algoriphagus sp. AK58]
MRYLLLIGLLCVTRLVFSQTITGTVREKGTGLPLPFANVFVSNTTFGKATDTDGKFQISGNLPQEIEVVASFVGYITEVKKVSTRGQSVIHIDFELVFNESNLSEIELKAKRDKSWERAFRRFEEVFLALPDDPYKSQIEIVNPWVVDFEKAKTNQGQNYLSASAQEPLKIINKALGYEIDYYLQDFRVLRNGSRFYGQVFYEPLSSQDPEEVAQWESAREINFHSSLRHLNESILLSSSDSLFFKLYHTLPEKMDRRRTNDFTQELNESIVLVSKDSILRRPIGDGNFRIFLPGRMEVHHLDKPWRNDYYTNVYHAISWIQAPDGYYDVDRKGVLLNPTQLVLSGYLGRQRMARILPLDFEPNRKFVTEKAQEEVITSSAIRFNRLREKVWLKTNKSYFYPGETAWIGGRMLYQDQALADSLSRVVYVDLINSNSEVIQSATFQIEQGKISGGLDLSAGLVPGDYVLRGYTHWSQNFGETDQFLAPFVVMETGFQPKAEAVESESFQGEITVKPEFLLSDSLNYRVMDLKLEILDEFQNPIDGEFILSMTDGESVVDLEQANSLEEQLNWLDRQLPDYFDSPLSYPIEYGISVRGKFTADNKRRPPINPITVVRGDLEDYGQVMTDSMGNFWATGLYFKDTAQIAVAAMDEKRRPYGSVQLMPLNRPKVPINHPRLSYTKEPILKENNGLDVSGDYILLEEFVKEEVRERETMAERNYGYGEPTQEVSGDILEKETMGEILGRFGFNLNTLKFRNYTYGERTGTPLLIIDGSSMPYMDPIEFRTTLLGFEPSQLESIKVYSDNIGKSIFGMAGYAGVIMIETKKGFRTGPESDRKFNSDGFQIFPIPGFTDFAQFPKNPPSDQYLKRKPTVYWEPAAETSAGQFKTKVKVPYGVKSIHIRVEGRTQDGEAFSKKLKVEF